MKLITEAIENVEVITEGKGDDKKLYIEGVFLQSEIKNRNGRMYPFSVLEKEVNRYNITFTANYEDKTEIKQLVLIVNYVETFEEEIVYNEALFFAIAGAEIIMSAGLGYWTQKIKKEKTYL